MCDDSVGGPGEVTGAGRYRFRAEHGDLLHGAGELPVDVVDRTCNAVIVPNHLHPERLGFAADLASGLRCPLVVMSTKAHGAEVLSALRARRNSGETYVLDLPWPAPMPLDGLATVDEIGARSPKQRDVASKRNLGLALARSQGWHRVLFLDDDIRHVTASQVKRASGALARDDVRAVSWRIRMYPDNSVVCHARRLAGLPQGTFIGSGALAVDVKAPLPFFPPVYNEDWLFLFDLLACRHVRLAGRAGQLRFNPFGLTERAQEEEFGDLLGEGVYHLLHEELPIDVAAKADFWGHVLQDRRNMVTELRQTLQIQGGNLPPRSASARRVAQALESLKAAAAEHLDTDLARSLASYVKAWRADLAVWNDWFEKVERVDDISEALEAVGVALDCLAVV